MENGWLTRFAKQILWGSQSYAQLLYYLLNYDFYILYQYTHILMTNWQYEINLITNNIERLIHTKEPATNARSPGIVDQLQLKNIWYRGYTRFTGCLIYTTVEMINSNYRPRSWFTLLMSCEWLWYFFFYFGQPEKKQWLPIVLFLLVASGNCRFLDRSFSHRHSLCL